MISPRREVSKAMRERVAFIPPPVEREQILLNLQRSYNAAYAIAFPLRRGRRSRSTVSDNFTAGSGEDVALGEVLGVDPGRWQLVVGVGVGLAVGVRSRCCCRRRRRSHGRCWRRTWRSCGGWRRRRPAGQCKGVGAATACPD